MAESAAADRPPLAAADQRRIGRLIRRTARGGRFQLCIIEIPTPRDGRAIERWIRAQMPDGLPVRRIDLGALPGENLWRELGAIAGDDEPAGWVLVGLEEHPPPERRKRVLQLNVQRDSLVRDFPGLWFLLVHPTLRDMLLRAAPDFVDYAVIWARAEGQEGSVPEAVPGASGFPVDRRGHARPPLPDAFQSVVDAIDEGRLNEAEDRLAVAALSDYDAASAQAHRWLSTELRIRRGDIASSIARWMPGGDWFEACAPEQRPAALRRLALLLFTVGELDRALALARDIMPSICDAEADRWELAQAQMIVADVLWSRGQTIVAEELWRGLADVVAREGDEDAHAELSYRLTFAAVRRGELDDAERIARDWLLPGDARGPSPREQVVALGLLAHIQKLRGRLDEALDIRREQILPRLHALGDRLGVAAEQGLIGDLLARRGEVDAALQIWGSLVPLYEELGAAGSLASTWSRIADGLFRQGAFDAAVEILRNRVLPTWHRAGEPRQAALASGRIALALRGKGEFDEAIRIYREDVLPSYDALGDIREAMVARANLASALLERNGPDDRVEATKLFRRAVATALAHGYAESADFAAMVAALGLPDGDIVEDVDQTT